MKGMKTGGRKKGTRNRRTSIFDAMLSMNGVEPLCELSRIVKDKEVDAAVRARILLAFLPYSYSTIKAISHYENDSRRITVDENYHRVD